MKRRYQDVTKVNSYETDDSFVNEDVLQTSALLRIADAAEKMAVSYSQIIQAKDTAERDKANFARWYNEEKEKVAALERSNAALRGVVTRLKNQVKAENAGEN